nr:immunoglobulin heavy chain junction region [Mus musculus]
GAWRENSPFAYW